MRSELSEAQQALEESDEQVAELQAQLERQQDQLKMQMSGFRRASSTQGANKPLLVEQAATAAATKKVEELSSRVVVLERQNAALKASIKALGHSPASLGVARTSSISVPAGKPSDPEAAPVRIRSNRKDSLGSTGSRSVSFVGGERSRLAQESLPEPETPSISRAATVQEAFRRPAASSSIAEEPGLLGASRKMSDDVMPVVPVVPRQTAAIATAAAEADSRESAAAEAAVSVQQRSSASQVSPPSSDSQQPRNQPAPSSQVVDSGHDRGSQPSSRRTTSDSAATNGTFSNSSPAVQQWEEQKRLQAKIASLQRKLAGTRDELQEAQRSIQRHAAQVELMQKERAGQAALVRELQEKLRQSQVRLAAWQPGRYGLVSSACPHAGSVLTGSTRLSMRYTSQDCVMHGDLASPHHLQARTSGGLPTWRALLSLTSHRCCAGSGHCSCDKP